MDCRFYLLTVAIHCPWSEKDTNAITVGMTGARSSACETKLRLVTLTCAMPHTDTHTHTHTHTHTDTCTHTDTHKHTQTHAHTQTRTNTHAHAHTQTHTQRGRESREGDNT